MKKIVYTDSMTVPHQIIFGPGDGMCGGGNYIKREKKIIPWSENITKIHPYCTDGLQWQSFHFNDYPFKVICIWNMNTGLKEFDISTGRQDNTVQVWVAFISVLHISGTITATTSI